MRGLPQSAYFGEVHERNRQANSVYIRSPYAIEYNPWTSKSEIEDAMFYRGVIVSSFGQVETILGEIAIRASHLPQYSALRNRFPYTFEKRIKFLRRTLAHQPLAQYKLLGSNVLNRVEGIAALRHMMAHSRMQVLGGQVTFHHIPQSDGQQINLRSRRFLFDALEMLAWRSAKIARAAHKLLNSLDQLDILPKLDELTQ